MTNTPVTTILSPTQLRHLECITRAWAKSLAGWRDSVEGIIATGKALTTAQTELNPDEFQAIQEEPQFPFGQRMVQMLEKVAKHPVLSDETCFAALPPHWGTLHALTQLSDKAIKKGLADGTINPRMERKDVAKLKPPKPCNVPDCKKPVHKDGYCEKHYSHPTAPVTNTTATPEAGANHGSPQDNQVEQPTTTNTTANYPVPNELTGAEKKLLTLLNTDHGLLTSLLVKFPTGLERFVASAFDEPTLQHGLRTIVERKRLFADLPVNHLEADQDDDNSSSTDGTIIIELPTSPGGRQASLEPAPEPLFENPEDEPVPPLDDRAPIGTPSGEMPDMIPELDRRGGRDPWANPSPSIAPEALQEMIDAGVDPDEAAERLQEQIDRWS